MTATESEVLHWLRIQPATIEELRLMLHTTRRDVEEAVESLRLAGEPIVGGADGLRLTENPEELAAYVEARRRRAVSIYLGTRALRRTAARMREVRDEQDGLTLGLVA
jgi:biotin operon repressor